jgi:hypothetical protein
VEWFWRPADLCMFATRSDLFTPTYIRIPARMAIF